MLRETGVNIIWIARGAIGNPWIFEHAASLLAHSVAATPASPVSVRQQEATHASQLQPPNIHEQRHALHEHFAIAMEIHGEQLAGRRMRKMGIKYSRFHPLAIVVKSHFINVKSLRDWNEVLQTFYHSDGPGVWPDPNAADEVNESPQSCEAVV